MWNAASRGFRTRNLMTALFIAFLLCAGFPVSAEAADFLKQIQSQFPGYVLFNETDFQPYIIRASSSPAIALGQFRSPASEFAALIHLPEKKAYKDTAMREYQAKLVVCRLKGRANCSNVRDLDAILPFQARVIRIPEGTFKRCKFRGKSYSIHGDTVGLKNDDKAGFTQFLFHERVFIACEDND